MARVLKCFCLLGALASIAARPDGSGSENNNNNGAEQWANDNDAYEDSGSQNSYDQNANEDESTNSYGNTHNYASAGKSHSQQQTLLYLKFPRDFGKVNPRDPKSLFKWNRADDGLLGSENVPLADNGVFKLVGGNTNNKNDEYGSQNSDNNKAYGGRGYLQLTSVPFVNNLYLEGYVITKQRFTVGNNERIFGRMKLSCQSIDTDQAPFSSTEVSHFKDDPRLGGCDFEMSNANGPVLAFYFILTNKSVWAVYLSSTFIAKRKVGVRERYDSIVDAGLEMDKGQNVVNYYLNGNKVWTVNAVGAPPPDDGINKVDLGSVGTPTLTNISQVQFSFGNGKCLDESDPYTPDHTRLVRILPANNPFYSPSTTFYDPTKARVNVDWGQGAITKAYKLIVVKAESKQLEQSSALPGVYGFSSSSSKD